MFKLNAKVNKETFKLAMKECVKKLEFGIIKKILPVL